MRKVSLIIFLSLFPLLGIAQGFNHTWLMGYTSNDMRMNFTDTSYTLIPEARKMGFQGTEGNISDANGNFLMSSNGVWIANSTNDTILNGSGLNPGWEVNNHPNGLLAANSNIFLPFPGDSTKIILFHHSMEPNANSYSGFPIFRSIIDLTLDSVILKNDTVLNDTINMGFAACKHGNGRDWWLVCQKESSDILITMLVTPSGVSNISYQSLGMPIARFNVTQIKFSQDGKKLAYTRYDPTTIDESLIIVDFDRCNGIFSNAHNIPLTLNEAVWGDAFSASGNFIYACSSTYIFQINVSSLTVDTVAVYDGFASPFPPFYTTFLHMYLAANGKIYITSGNSVLHLHEMNFPDSLDTACDVQQHSIPLPGFDFRAVPNHPNYYLGCDSTGGCPCYVGIEEPNKHNFHFNIIPNPSNGNFNVGYLIPHNKIGKLEIFDITGKRLYSQPLPQWSTEQQINLPNISEGLYNCTITSGNTRVSKKIAIIKE